MGHAICALVVAEPVDLRRAAAVDLRPMLVHEHVTVLPVDHFYSAYWSARRGDRSLLDLPGDVPVIFPMEDVLVSIVREMTGVAEPLFAVIQTDYFGGTGRQWAVAFRGADRLTGEGTTINHALAVLGVRKLPSLDEFDSIGLGAHRSNPEYLERYKDLCDELGV